MKAIMRYGLTYCLMMVYLTRGMADAMGKLYTELNCATVGEAGN